MEALHKILALVGATEPIGNATPVARDSRHAGGRRRPRGWHRKLRARRKVKRLARRAHRRG